MAVAQDKRTSELTAPVSIADTDMFPGYRPGTGGEPNLDIRASAGLIRAPILAGLAAGDVAVDGIPSAKNAGAMANGTADDVGSLAQRFTDGSTTVLTPASYSVSSLTVPYGKTLVIQRGAQLQVSGTTISIQGQVRAPDAVFGPPGLCASIGDSRTGGSAYAIPGTSLTNLNTLWTMCMLRTNGALQWTPELSFGIGGSTTTSLDAQITSLAATSRLPRYCYVLSGTNDDGTVTADEQVRRFVNAWLRLLGMGIVPIHICDLPRVQSSYTAALCSRNRQCQARLATLARHMGVIFVDGTPVMTDYSNTTGDPLAASFSTDLIHQSPVGNYAIAGVLSSLLLGKMLVPAWGHLASPTGADVYHATNNPYGNNWINPLFIGTGGAKGSNVTGNVPTGYTVTRNTGANSAVGLRSMPVRYLFLDEVDGYPLDVEGEGDAISLAEASAIKYYCSQAATDVAMEAVQLFGGNGYMTEYRVEQLARDAKSLMIYAGSNEVQITHVARGLLGG